jgi:predicted nicotinamide N-methyase
MLPVPYVPFSMRYREFEFGFVRPADPESILDAMTNEEYEKDKLLPYWAEQWPASFALFNFLAHRSQSAVLQSGLVCELGTGLGIASSVLASRGVRCVATDIALNACRFSQHNILTHASRPLVTCCDWRAPCFGRVFDCIIASDVLYEQRWIDPILRFLSDTLKPEGIAYIADPMRQWWNSFKVAQYAAGFASTVVWEDWVNEGKTKVEILKLERRRK